MELISITDTKVSNKHLSVEKECILEVYIESKQNGHELIVRTISGKTISLLSIEGNSLFDELVRIKTEIEWWI